MNIHDLTIPTTRIVAISILRTSMKIDKITLILDLHLQFCGKTNSSILLLTPILFACLYYGSSNNALRCYFDPDKIRCPEKQLYHSYISSWEVQRKRRAYNNNSRAVELYALPKSWCATCSARQKIPVTTDAQDFQPPHSATSTLVIEALAK